MAYPAGGVDETLSDLPTAWYIYGQMPPVRGRHSGYWADSRVWDLVDRWAADLPLPQPTARPPGGV